jgi:hypothetical protein
MLDAPRRRSDVAFADMDRSGPKTSSPERAGTKAISLVRSK